MCNFPQFLNNVKRTNNLEFFSICTGIDTGITVLVKKTHRTTYISIAFTTQSINQLLLIFQSRWKICSSWFGCQKIMKEFYGKELKNTQISLSCFRMNLKDIHRCHDDHLFLLFCYYLCELNIIYRLKTRSLIQ